MRTIPGTKSLPLIKQARNNLRSRLKTTTMTMWPWHLLLRNERKIMVCLSITTLVMTSVRRKKRKKRRSSQSLIQQSLLRLEWARTLKIYSTSIDLHKTSRPFKSSKMSRRRMKRTRLNWLMSSSNWSMKKTRNSDKLSALKSPHLPLKKNTRSFKHTWEEVASKDWSKAVERVLEPKTWTLRMREQSRSSSKRYMKLMRSWGLYLVMQMLYLNSQLRISTRS